LVSDLAMLAGTNQASLEFRRKTKYASVVVALEQFSKWNKIFFPLGAMAY
jgi:hypothetical protein